MGHAARVVEGDVGGGPGQQRGGLLARARLPQAAQQEGRAGCPTLSYMEDWRVLVTLLDPPARRKSYRSEAIPGLRRRLGAHIAVGSGETGIIFLYAETEDAAEEAAQVALEVLAQHEMAADFRLERWDGSAEAWLDPRAGQPEQPIMELPAADAKKGRLRSKAGGLAGAIVESIGEILPF